MGINESIGRITPLSITFEAPGRVLISLFGALSKDVVPALSATVSVAKAQIKSAAAGSPDGQVRILLDMSAFSGEYDAAALEVMSEFAKTNAPYVAKTAVFGGPETGDMAAEVAAALAGRENIKTFATKAEAEAWLES